MKKRVEFRDGCVLIDGQPTVLLCSSFFYFRVPPEYWRPRMRDLKLAGYNAIDVYFPWNFHETAPGVWDFSGERDVAAFLRCAAEEELYVVARPGPYICSEWDGGGIPIWVHQATDQVRQFDDTYLSMFGKWMDRIMPHIQRFQLGAEGTVVMLQLENELDLFPCRHAHRYMESIRNMVDRYDMIIPYVACVAGKGDVDAATGSVDGIVPSFNIYPPFSDPTVEEKMEIIQKRILMPKGWPLLATETEREHNFMRRELASGVRLISPYCQMASTNFDCRNGISSWSGTPEKRIVYIADNYDMNSMLKSDGAFHHEYPEARLLANIIRTYGSAIAAGEPFADHPFTVHTEFRTNDEGVHAMRLSGGGWLLCLPNLSRDAGSASVEWQGETHYLMIEGDTTRLLPFDLPLTRWGFSSARIVWSMSDLLWIGQGEMVLCGDGDGLCLEINGVQRVITEDTVVTLDGQSLVVRWMSRKQASRARSPFLPPLEKEPFSAWESQDLVPEACVGIPWTMERKNVPLQAMENLGLYNGACTWTFDVPSCRYLMLRNAADIATVWQNGVFLKTWISDAGMQILPVTGGRITVRSEMWGHTCFDECYNPLLHMQSLRGLEGAYAVLEERNIGSNWLFAEDDGPFGPYVTPKWSELPSVTGFGNLIPRGFVLSGSFRREIRMPDTGDRRFLRFEGIGMKAALYLNGRLVGEIDRTNPWMDITEVTCPGEIAEIVVRLRADSVNSAPGTISLIAAQDIPRGDLVLRPMESLKALEAKPVGSAGMPLSLRGGECRLLRVHVSPEEGLEKWLRPQGTQIKTTIIGHGHVLGRLFSGCDLQMLIRAGDDARVWLPREWLREDPEVLLLVEGMADNAVLNRITIDQR